MDTTGTSGPVRHADRDRQVRRRPGRRPALRPRPPPWCGRRSAGRAWIPSDVGHAVFGNVIHTEARDMYLGRVAAVNGGLPVETPAFTLNRLCGSGLQAIVSAAQAIKLGDCDVAVAGGAESMSRGQYWLPGMRWGQRMQDGVVVDAMVGALTDPFDDCHMGVTAENVAADYGVSRADQDALAAESHRRAAAAADGRVLHRADHPGRGAGAEGHRDRRHRRARPARRDHGRPGQAAAGVRRGRHGHRGQRLGHQRRRGRGRAGRRGFRRAARAHPARAAGRLQPRRGRAEDHGHGPGARGAQGARPGRA